MELQTFLHCICCLKIANTRCLIFLSDKTTTTTVFSPLQAIWDVDSLDWKDYDAATIIRRVTEHKHLGNGSIILCHNGGKHTAEALDELLTILKKKGFQLVPISALIMKDNYTINTEGRQVKN